MVRLSDGAVGSLVVCEVSGAEGKISLVWSFEKLLRMSVRATGRFLVTCLGVGEGSVDSLVVTGSSGFAAGASGWLSVKDLKMSVGAVARVPGLGAGSLCKLSVRISGLVAASLGKL